MKLSGLSESPCGFTLMEVMITLGAAAIFMAGVYGFFATFAGSSANNQSFAGMQQDLRAALEFMEFDLRMAGLDPLGTSGAGVERISSGMIRVTSDRNMNGLLNNKDFERVTYLYDPDAGTLKHCLYEGTKSASWQTVIQNVDAFSITAYDTEAKPTGDPEKIRLITVNLQLRESGKRVRGLQSTVKLRNF